MSGLRRHGTGGPWEDAVGYSRVVATDEAAWTAGCTATVAGQVVHEGNAYEQARTAFGIALAALADVGFGVQDVVRTRMYVHHQRDAEAVGRAHAELLGQVRPAATLLVVSGFVDQRMLVEVEVDAVRPRPAPSPPTT